MQSNETFIHDELDAGIISGLLQYDSVVPVVFDTIDSTNLELKRRVRSGEISDDRNYLIIANEQTLGRGRLGRRFESPVGSGIYMSLLLKPDSELEDAILVTTAAAVAVARGIEESTGIDSQIKWVNDIYVNKKKVCGILTESIIDGNSGINIILGIGINVTTSSDSFSDDVKGIAGALYDSEEEQQVSRNNIVASIINSYMEIYQSLQNRDYMKEYKERSMVIGREVRYLSENEWHEAIVLDIDDDGGLVVSQGSATRTLRTGEITLRLA